MIFKESRWFAWIFPKSMEITDDKITFVKRNLPNFWAHDTDVVPADTIASFRVDQGWFWSAIIIETKGGMIYSIENIWNKQTKEIEELLNRMIKHE